MRICTINRYTEHNENDVYAIENTSDIYLVVCNVYIKGTHLFDYYTIKGAYSATNVTSYEDILNYVDCFKVDGDTCDGYYTEEDVGKVQTVNTSGEKSLISVYDKEEIDTKLGDISTILTALHEGGIQ